MFELVFEQSHLSLPLQLIVRNVLYVHVEHLNESLYKHLREKLREQHYHVLQRHFEFLEYVYCDHESPLHDEVVESLLALQLLELLPSHALEVELEQ